MKTPRLASALYALVLVFVLMLSVLRIKHQLPAESFWRLFSLGLLLGNLVRWLPKPQAKRRKSKPFTAAAAVVAVVPR